jgi:DNA-directed RNA polymerase subunit RPC12/RpoP
MCKPFTIQNVSSFLFKHKINNIITMSNYVCITCDKKYASLNSLNNHKRNYHNKEEDGKYKCDYCVKKYISIFINFFSLSPVPLH